MEGVITIGELIKVLLAVCGGIITVSGAVVVIMNWVSKAKAPELAQNERITELEKRVTRHDELLDKDNRRIVQLEEGNRVVQRAILALLAHGIDGNDIEAMKQAKHDLEKYLLNK